MLLASKHFEYHLFWDPSSLNGLERKSNRALSRQSTSGGVNSLGGQKELHLLILVLCEMKGGVRTRGGISVGRGQQAAEDHGLRHSQRGLES